MKDPEYREIRARRAFTSYVDRRVGSASAGPCPPLGDVSKKLEIIRAAVQHDYPVSDIDDMLAEIESGYGTGTRP
jgi:hypothetical protein